MAKEVVFTNLAARIFGYTRVSTSEQSQGQSPAAQQELIEDYAKARIRGATFVRHFDDVGSGGVPLSNRKQGARLLLELERGDHVVCSKLDRAFRSVHDLCVMIDQFHTLGVHFHALDVGFDTSTASGKAFVQMMGVFAEFERGRNGERVRDRNVVRRHLGLPISGPPPYGHRIVGEHRARKLVPCPEEREVGKLIVQWKLGGSTWEEIYWHLHEHGITRRKGKEYNIAAIRRAFVGECQLQARENTHPSEQKK